MNRKNNKIKIFGGVTIFARVYTRSNRNIISHPLAIIINKSLELGYFPNSLKKACVTPIFKEGDKTDINNYRPISVLPTFSKIYEKIVYKQLYEYLERNSYLDNNQYGFRANRSTSHAILNLLQYTYQNLDSSKIVFSLFLDFRKAFDSVNHKILLSKLKIYGIRGIALDWFCSYLSERSQYVFINGSRSSVKKIEYGVPQGSILGPLLFLIFINDITKSSKLFNYILYADDSTLSTCFSEDELGSHSNLINEELKRVYKWLCANKIAINETKTKYMIFTYNKNITMPLIKIGNNIISEASVIKYLGIHIDNHLNFTSHINVISSKISKSIGLLYKLNKYLPYHVLKIIYSTLIHPYLIYGIEAWHSTFKNHTNKIFTLQKKAIRAMNNLDYNEHTNNYFKSNRILKLEDQFKLQVSNYIYKLLNCNNIDTEISSKLMTHHQIHHRETRHGEQLNVMRIKRSKSKNIIYHNGVKIWNSVPSKIKSLNTRTKFKISLKKLYVDSY